MNRPLVWSWLLVVGLGACASDRDVGSASMALTGQAPSGTSYRLREAELVVAGPSPLTLRTEDDPARTVIETELPVGAYTLTVASGWRVERVAPGQPPQPVVAELVSPSPLPFEIRGGAVTPVVLRFRVGADIVDMGPGSAAIGVEFDEGDGGPGPGVDAGVDGAADGSVDAITDAGVDAGADASVDAGVDAGPSTDVALAVEVEATEIFEGTAIATRVRLAAPPVGAVVLTATTSDGTALIATPSLLAFTPTTWDRPQTVILTAAPDADAVHGSASLRLAGAGAIASATAFSLRDRDATGEVTVRVLGRETYDNRGQPVSAQVVFRDPSGVTRQVPTDARGEVRALILAGTSVTVVEDDDRRFTTFEQVEPGDVLTVGDERPAVPDAGGEATLHVPGADPGDLLFATAPCSWGSSSTEPSPLRLSFWGCPPTAQPLVVTRSVWSDVDDDWRTLGFLLTSAVLAPGVEHVLSGPWLEPLTVRASTTAPELQWFPNRLRARLYVGRESGYQVEPEYFLPGPAWIGYASFAWPRAASAAGAVTWIEHAMETDVARQSLASTQAEAPATLAIADTDMALPWVSKAFTRHGGGVVDGATWTVGDGMPHDGVVVEIRGDGDECYPRWTVIAPPGTSSGGQVRLPALPSELQARWNECAETGSARVRLIQASSITSFRQLRAVASQGEIAEWALPAMGLDGVSRTSENRRR